MSFEVLFYYILLFFLLLYLILIYFFQMGLSTVWVHYAGTGLDTTIEDSPDDLMTQISDISREIMMDYSDQRQKTKVCLNVFYFISLSVLLY